MKYWDVVSKIGTILGLSEGVKPTKAGTLGLIEKCVLDFLSEKFRGKDAIQALDAIASDVDGYFPDWERYCKKPASIRKSDIMFGWDWILTGEPMKQASGRNL